MRRQSISYHLCNWVWSGWPESTHTTGHVGHWWLWEGPPYPSFWLAEAALEQHRADYPDSGMFLSKKITTEEMEPVR